MRITMSLIMLLCLGTVAAAQNKPNTNTSQPSAPTSAKSTTVTRNLSVKPETGAYCTPQIMSVNPNVFYTSGGSGTVTYSFTEAYGQICGSPQPVSTGSWIQFYNNQCNEVGTGVQYNCSTQFTVTQNTGGTRQANVTIPFGSPGTLGPVTVTQYGPVEELTVSVSGSGTVTSSPSGISCPSTCSLGIYYGNTYTLTASPATGYKFAGWSGACSGTGTCPLPMTAPENVTATFTQLSETLSVGVSGSGTVTGSGISCPGTCSATYAYGTNISLSASPAAGYQFTGWSGACSGTGSCTVSMTAASSISRRPAR